MRCRQAFLFVAAVIAATGRTEAGPMYNVTQLAGDYSTRRDATGHIVGLIDNGNGALYAFDKVPVTVAPGYLGGFANAHNYHVEKYLTNGTTTIGYDFISPYHSPSGQSITNFGVWESYNGGVPVMDFNIHGVAVGFEQTPGGGKYAEVSTPNFGMHDGSSLLGIADRMNQFLPTSAGIAMISANLIDDLGRIVASGRGVDEKSHNYMLTPVDLGSATPIPEPSTLVLFAAIGVGAVAIRRRRSR